MRLSFFITSVHFLWYKENEPKETASLRPITGLKLAVDAPPGHQHHPWTPGVRGIEGCGFRGLHTKKPVRGTGLDCYGAENEARTRDPHLGKVVLYH